MKILVVESSLVVRERLLCLLAASGRYEGFVCDAGAGDALELVRSGQPAAVLLGLRLSDVSGFDVLKNLRVWGQTLPVVMLAECSDRRYQAKAQALGANALLSQASQFEEIVPTLDRLLGRGGGKSAVGRCTVDALGNHGVKAPSERKLHVQEP